MTDPERLSKRSGLAAELLRVGAAERPDERGMQRTLLALGFSSVILSTSHASTAGGAKLTHALSAGAGTGTVGVGATSTGAVSTGAAKAVSAILVAKWMGVGVLCGMGFAGVAGVATRASGMQSAVQRGAAPAPQLRRTDRAQRVNQAHRATAAPTQSDPQSEPSPAIVDSADSKLAVSAAPAASPVGTVEPRAPGRDAPGPELSDPLVAEVAYVDRARALLDAGQSSHGLALLESYEHQFSEVRLLPEVLFLELEAYERSGRSADARRAAERLLSSFPKSPHTGQARRLLGQ